MIEFDSEEIMVKIVWNRVDNSWGSQLLTINEETGFVRRPLHSGEEISFEFTGNRGCIGYVGEDGRYPCPEFNFLDSGRQCYACRQRDKEIEYVEGRSGKMRTGEHSVYLAVAGGKVKVGVTRTERLERRWIEQGASYATEIEVFENAQEALEKESEISDRGISERIMKTTKYDVEDDRSVLKDEISSLGYNNVNVVDVQSMSMYNSPGRVNDYVKDNKVSGNITSVKGQILYVDDIAVGVTQGKCVSDSSQESILSYM